MSSKHLGKHPLIPHQDKILIQIFHKGWKLLEPLTLDGDEVVATQILILKKYVLNVFVLFSASISKNLKLKRKRKRKKKKKCI